MKHAKASASNPEPEAEGEGGGDGDAVATKVVVGAEGHHPDSTSVPPQSPQVPLLLVFNLVQLSSLVQCCQIRISYRGLPWGLYMPDLGERPVSDGS